MVCMFAGRPVFPALVVVTLARDPSDAGLMTWIMLSPRPPSMVKNLAGLTDPAADTPGDVMEEVPSSWDVINPSDFCNT